MSQLVAIKSARANASTTHAGVNIGWASIPLCPALKTGKREVIGSASAWNTVTCRPCIDAAIERGLSDIEMLAHIGPRLRALIDAVRTHAVEHYNDAQIAWDVVVEAYSDFEIAEAVRRAQTAAGAIRAMARRLGGYSERRAYHQAEIAAATEPAHDCGIAAHDHISEVSASQCAILRGGKDKPEATYDRFAEGTHPDGSVVIWHSDPVGGESWGERHWPGKQCRGEIAEAQEGPDGDYVTREHYIPAWRGVFIESPNVCYGLPF